MNRETAARFAAKILEKGVSNRPARHCLFSFNQYADKKVALIQYHGKDITHYDLTWIEPLRSIEVRFWMLESHGAASIRQGDEAITYRISVDEILGVLPVGIMTNV